MTGRRYVTGIHYNMLNFKGLLRNGLTSCLATSPSSLIGCHSQAPLNFKKMSNACCVMVRRSSGPNFKKIKQHLWREDFFRFLIKSKMAENPIWRKNPINDALSLDRPKGSSDTSFVKNGWTGQKLINIQLWPVGGARALELELPTPLEPK